MGETVLLKNYSWEPDLKKEGKTLKPLPAPKKVEGPNIWYQHLKPHERTFLHQTLNNARKYVKYRQVDLIPKDSLDFQLSAKYVHCCQLFPSKVDYLIQGETIGESTFRRLRNTTDAKQKENLPDCSKIFDHPLIIGGITEKYSPHSVKLMNSGIHSQLTNPGYSRQPADGNFFHY